MVQYDLSTLFERYNNSILFKIFEWFMNINFADAMWLKKLNFIQKILYSGKKMAVTSSVTYRAWLSATSWGSWCRRRRCRGRTASRCWRLRQTELCFAGPSEELRSGPSDRSSPLGPWRAARGSRSGSLKQTNKQTK